MYLLRLKIISGQEYVNKDNVDFKKVIYTQWFIEKVKNVTRHKSETFAQTN